jgi:uncharacterized membrane protein
MKWTLVLSIAVSIFTSGIVSAASFQGLGGVEAETFVREKYRSADNQVWVGRGPYTGMNDLNVELASATPFGPSYSYPNKVAVRWGLTWGSTYEWMEIAAYDPWETGPWESRWSAANAVSSDGSTIVGFTGDGLDVVKAFQWSSSGGTQLLNQGVELGIANDISNDGLIVGNSSPEQGIDPLACVWEDGENLVYLKQWLSNNYDLNIGAWTLTNAIGISTDGSTIVGYGINPDGIAEGWVASVPEPMTLSLLALGGLLIRKCKL